VAVFTCRRFSNHGDKYDGGKMFGEPNPSFLQLKTAFRLAIFSYDFITLVPTLAKQFCKKT
jgi:hypothetical protein